MMKRIWIFVLIVLALLMCVGAAGAEVTASGTCGKNGDNLHWTLENGVMTITGTGEMADTSLWGGMPWKKYQDNITSVVIGEGATYIGECAFYNCTNLTSVTLPTTLQRIGIQAFFNCKKLPEIVVPEGVTSLAYGAFEACSVLVNATLPSTLKIMEQKQCSSLLLYSFGWWLNHLVLHKSEQKHCCLLSLQAII